jgi:hypothetical protein
MRPYRFTMVYPFQTEKSSLQSFLFVGAHCHAPDDQSTQDRHQIELDEYAFALLGAE